jgi:WD40 repeat protein
VLAMTSDQSSVALFDYDTGQRLHTFSLDAGPVSAVEFSPGGETLLVAWSEGGIRLFDAATYALKRELPAAPAFLEAAKYSPDGQYILTGEGWPRFTATLWEVASGEPVRTFRGHQWVVSALGFSADGASVVTGADIVREWSILDLAARLRIEKVEGEARLSWAVGELQHATRLGEGWQVVTNASSPFPVPLMNAGFFRVRVEESE